MEEIRNEMFNVFDTMLEKFPTVGIRYEFDQEYECFLVSFDVSALEPYSLEMFSELYLTNINAIQDRFGDDAPLFCMNEEWFSLSKDAVSYFFSKEEESNCNFEWINEISEIKVKVKSVSVHQKNMASEIRGLLLAA